MKPPGKRGKHNVVNLKQSFEGKRVWLSGHTGFKGSWLSEWLLDLGAIVRGYALTPDTKPALFDQLELVGRLEHEVADIRNGETVGKSIHSFRPDFVIHMAAQPLVRRSYAIPIETYETNVMGTIHVLEALRGLTTNCSAVIVTTDKCYENHESGRDYEESDSLGGHDPYSSSKAMAEIATAAYRKSYFQNGTIRIASARAGNVIGGGDWAEDRIVPDAMRALDNKESISVRNPRAVRPWQHVLEPLGGYLSLVSGLVHDKALATAFNFGPGPDSNRTVSDLVVEILKHRKGEWTDASDPTALHEATLLNLSIEKADQLLGWRPKWGFEETISKTVAWYARVHIGTVSALEITQSQIAEYQENLP
ncbi:MAG: CDP-glucose 4,6-dehydratase [Verrucomicrobia bacterium]|nr:CDP-glucose 4,6-dehydratase [Verrucomicrobiota bacterium]